MGMLERGKMKDIYVLCYVENGHRQLLGGYETIGDAKWNVAAVLAEELPEESVERNEDETSTCYNWRKIRKVELSLEWEPSTGSDGSCYPILNPAIQYNNGGGGYFVIEVVSDAPVVGVLKMRKLEIDRRFVEE